MIKGAIFDLDGTLTDTLEHWNKIIPDYVRQQGFEPDIEHDRDAILSLSMPEAAARVKERYHLTPSIDEICAAWGKASEHIYTDIAVLKDGAADFLKRLHHAGIPMVICTNNYQPFAEALLKRNGVLHYFEDLFCGFTLGLGKSEPTMMEMARKAIGSPVNGTWMFEDSLTPVCTANFAGYNTLALIDPNHPSTENEQLRQTATVVCENYDDIHRWLDTMHID